MKTMIKLLGWIAVVVLLFCSVFLKNPICVWIALILGFVELFFADEKETFF